MASETREFGYLDAVNRGLAAILVLTPLVIALDRTHTIWALLETDQWLFLALGVGTAVTFWTPGAFRSSFGQKSEIMLGASALAVALWATVRFEIFGYGFATSPLEPMAIAGIMLVFTAFACRRFAGWPMTLVVVTFAIFGYFAQFLPEAIASPPTSIQRYVMYLGIDGDSLVGRPLKIIFEVVLVFVLFSKFFELAGGTEFIKQVAIRLTRRSIGAPIKLSIIASGLIGSIIGSTSANILTSGSFSIPLMKRIGLTKEQAAGVEAVASTGGQLTPPVMGLAAFLMVEIAEVPYSTIIVAAAAPAALFYWSLFLQADRFAIARPFSDGQLPDPLPWRNIAWLSLPFIGSLLTLLVILFRMDYAPEFAAAAGVVVAFIFTIIRNPKMAFDIRVVTNAFVNAGLAASGLVVMAASVGIIVGVVNATALGVTFTIMISDLAGSSLFLALIVAAVASYFLGIGLATTAVYAVSGTLIAPSLVELGLSPIAAHLFVFYTAMLSMITPPVAIGCLAASSLAGSDFIKTSIFAVRFGWLKFVLPFIFVYSPELLMIGAPIEIAAVLLSAAIGIVLFTNALSGYGPNRLTLISRIINLAWSIAVMLPILDTWTRFGLAILALPVLMGTVRQGTHWARSAEKAKQT